VKALESGNSVLKSLTEKTSVDHVTDVMDELAEVLMAMYNVQEFVNWAIMAYFNGLWS